MSHPPTSAQTARAREQFASQHHLLLPGFLEPELLESLIAQIDDGNFETKVHGDIGVELCMKEGPATDALCFLTNDPLLFRFVRDVSGCASIGCFLGRLYRVAPGGVHHDDWHDDNIEGRLVGMTLNLSASQFSGGELHMRERATGRPLCSVANTGPGDAVLFELGDALEHRIGDLTGSAPKTAYAGWFKQRPSFMDLLAKRARWTDGS